jgi:diphosphomevalonate decarboxylase
MSANTVITARANANIALIKYWGKRAGEPGRNLPAVGSLSITLDALATTTRVEPNGGLPQDEYRRGGEPRPAEAPRVIGFMDRIRQLAGDAHHARIDTDNNFPTGAGLASSASGFAALALAASRAYGLETTPRELSMLARDGSGSAARSLFGGFVRMHRGEQADGSDAFAEPLYPADHWPLRVVIAITDAEAKATGSTDGMQLTEQTSPYFDAWMNNQDVDLEEAVVAVRDRDFDRLADVSEFSCLKMHASALAARPGVLYWNAGTVTAIQRVRELRAAGVPVFFTVDAGPQVKAVCLPDAEQTVVAAMQSVAGVTQVIATRLGADAEVIG